ncbi:MAG: bacillithiol system redox-active protein YtxJ [Dethiobacter sp.]|jgi:bacillithiol system protein YtxJ|nr:bacillithiol system redox-active protein YtxJ [Dethiobacter sp.]MCL4463934.1 bacillithiol system redox-active protein YtxJ [Bacillota bacterium]MCL5993891.1 bacillithiol system redox-active protein YtxJ [Bacillota bacterium]
MSKLTFLEDIAALEQALASAGNKPLLIFKHSSTCPISARAHREVDKFLTSDALGETLVCAVVVQNARNVSDAVAAKTGVRHETPQALLIRDGQCVWNTSHKNITLESLKEATAKD